MRVLSCLVVLVLAATLVTFADGRSQLPAAVQELRRLAVRVIGEWTEAEGAGALMEAQAQVQDLPIVASAQAFKDRHCGINAECTANEHAVIDALSLQTLQQIDAEIKDTWNWKGPNQGTQGWKHVVAYMMLRDKQSAVRLSLLATALETWGQTWPTNELSGHAATIKACLAPVAADISAKVEAPPARVSQINLPALLRAVTQSVLAIHAVARVPVNVPGLRTSTTLAQNPAYRCAYSCWNQVRRAKTGSICPRFMTQGRHNSPPFAVGGVAPQDENENIFISAAGWGPYALGEKGVTLQISNGRLSTWIPGDYKDYILPKNNYDEARTQQRLRTGCYQAPIVAQPPKAAAAKPTKPPRSPEQAKQPAAGKPQAGAGAPPVK